VLGARRIAAAQSHTLQMGAQVVDKGLHRGGVGRKFG
jgi:hypothetical protein